MEALKDEVWKDVKGFEGRYRISNKGRLLSFSSKGWNFRSNVNKKGEYFTINLINKDIRITKRIHRLVYEAFIGEIPKGRNYYVHHIDGNKQNNNVENLQLLDAKEHSKLHRQRNPNIVAGMVCYNKYVRPKPIMQFDLKGNYINTYNNAVEAYKATGVCARNIIQVANKEAFNKKGNYRKQAGGYIWQYLK